MAGVWGYVCDDGFGFVEADMACRSLGYERALSFTRNSHFGAKKPGQCETRSTFTKVMIIRMCDVDISMQFLRNNFSSYLQNVVHTLF